MVEVDGYAVDRSCKHLIRGHLGGYHYRKAEIAGGSGESRGHLEIADTAHTHVADAEQYGALEGEHVIADIRGRGRREGRTVVNDSSYEILGGNWTMKALGFLVSPVLLGGRRRDLQEAEGAVRSSSRSARRRARCGAAQRRAAAPARRGSRHRHRRLRRRRPDRARQNRAWDPN
jgi:hypothetical protein